MKIKTVKEDRGEGNARAGLQNILAMVKALHDAGEDKTKREQAEIAINEDALSVEVISGWYVPGGERSHGSEAGKPEHYRILLTTGGPALQLTGELSEHGEPVTARLEYQDWGTPWTEYVPARSHESELLEYAGQFYFGE